MIALTDNGITAIHGDHIRAGESEELSGVLWLGTEGQSQEGGVGKDGQENGGGGDGSDGVRGLDGARLGSVEGCAVYTTR